MITGYNHALCSDGLSRLQFMKSGFNDSNLVPSVSHWRENKRPWERDCTGSNSVQLQGTRTVVWTRFFYSQNREAGAVLIQS